MTISANSKNNQPEKVMCEKLPMQENGIVRLSTVEVYPENKVTTIIESVE